MSKLLVILLVVLVGLIPAVVSADELWVKNEGALEIVVDGVVADVQYDGVSAFNSAYADGQSKVVACDIKDGWVVITGDFTGYTIELACGQDFKDVAPEVKWVKDAPLAIAAPVYHEDSGPSVAEVTMKDIVVPDWMWSCPF